MVPLLQETDASRKEEPYRPKLDWKVRLGQITSDHASLIVRVIEAPVLKILDEWYGGEMSAGDSVGRLREINNAIDILTR